MRPSALVFIIVVVLLFNRSPWVDAANGHDLIISNLSDFGCFQMNVRPILERFSQLASSAKLFQDGHAHGSLVGSPGLTHRTLDLAASSCAKIYSCSCCSVAND
jgi:hypothetical protein